MNNFFHTDHLTKNDAIYLKSSIRSFISQQNEGSFVTIEDICKNINCKYGFARCQLKEMVKEGILISEPGRGSIKERFYLDASRLLLISVEKIDKQIEEIQKRISLENQKIQDLKLIKNRLLESQK